MRNALCRSQGHKVTRSQVSSLSSLSIVLLVICSTMALSGCASTKEMWREIAGTSTKALEEGKANAVTMSLNQDYFRSYNNCLQILKGMETFIYARDIKKDMIALYLSEVDTTPVGIFFKRIDERTTQIQVTSPSTFAKEFIAEKLFSALAEQLK